MGKLRCWFLVYLTLFLLVLRTSSQSSNAPTPFYYQLLEEQSSGYYISNIKQDAGLADVYDEDTLASLRFQFLIQPSIRVGLDPVSGALSTSGRIDRDAICPGLEICNVTLQIAVQPVQYFQIFKAVVTILDMNDNTPTFPQPSIVKPIAESADIGDTVVLPSAADSDSPRYGVVRYELHGQDAWAFDLDSVQRLDGVNEVKLLLQITLDREGKDRYSLKIWAYDGGEPARSGYIDVTVEVQDSNDNPPVFENSTYYANLPENFEVGATFLRVRAHDPDIGLNGALTYDLSYYSREMYGTLFSVDRRTGEMRLESALDYEHTQRYTLSVIATDKGPDPIETEATVVVNVLDINDFEPQITINTLDQSDTDRADIVENLDANTFVAHVSVVDDDSGGTGEVICTLSDPDFDLVKLYDKEYKVVTRVVLDRENQSVHDVLVICEDDGEPSLRSVKHFEVKVIDENDNSPLFTSNIYNSSIFENNNIGASILQVNAEDLDFGANGAIEYSIPSSVSDRVSINASTGLISALRSFDREYESRIVFNVLAKDSGDTVKSSSSTVIINIKDVNDERPLFTESITTMNIIENSDAGTFIGTALASDEDAYPYNQIEYSLLPNNHSWMFSIDSTTGSIFAEVELDREIRTHYLVTVAATDVHNSALFSCLDVDIRIEDVNDETPTFLFPSNENHTVYISPDVPVDYLVTKVFAIDLDQGHNARLTFSILDGNSRDRFYLHHSSGYLTVAESLSDIDYREFSLELLVEDGGDEKLSSISSLKVVVDSAISYSSRSKNSDMLSRTKLIIIVSLSIASAILIVILLIAIFFLHRLEVKRKLHQKNQTRMERLSKLTVNNNQTAIVRNSGKTGSLGKGGVSSAGSELWKTPEENELEGESETPLLFGDGWNAGLGYSTNTFKAIEERKLPHWPTSYPASALKYSADSTDQGHETDVSADGSQTTDSGRGPSDIGESSHKATPQRSTTPKSMPTQRSASPALRTFTPSPTLDATSGDKRTDTQFKIVHARPVNVVTTPTRTSTRPSSPRKGAVVRIDDFQNSDPKRARAYYKDAPLYSQNQTNSSPQLQNSSNQNRTPESKSQVNVSNGNAMYIKDTSNIKNSTFV